MAAQTSFVFKTGEDNDPNDYGTVNNMRFINCAIDNRPTPHWSDRLWPWGAYNNNYV